MSQKPTPSKRIIALDYLRGFFITVIIIDHLWRWPNIFAVISGRGELWASAAEGFVIISGLLVGYIRGYKNRNLPLKDVSKKLITRGILLYVWMIITSIVLVTISWQFEFKGDMAYIPINVGDWGTLISSTLRFDYVHTLTHFLYLYAIFLVISPVVIWLERQGKSWVVAVCSSALWLFGVMNNIEWMQWQLLFFLPSIIGFYFEVLLDYYHKLPLNIRLWIRYGSILTMAITVVVSAAIILPHDPGAYKDTLFGRDPVTLPTILISFIWFAGLLSLFQLILPWLKKWFGWLILTFGERSLTAYIVHTIPLVICQLFFTESDNFWLNSVLTLSCILGTWAILKVPYINKVIPR